MNDGILYIHAVSVRTSFSCYPLRIIEMVDL